MKLEVNKSHLKADLSTLKDNGRRIKASILGITCAALVFTGAQSIDQTYAEAYNEYDDSYSASYEELTYEIPRCYRKAICEACNKSSIKNVSNDDISNITSLRLEIDGNEPLEFLNMLPNLNSLCLEFCDSNNEFALDTFPCVPTLRKLEIIANEDLEISEKVNNRFIYNNMDNINYLDLEGVSVGPNTVETFTNLDTLTLGISENNELNFKNLKVNNLDLSWYGPYDVPIFLPRQDYDSLKSSGVNINFGSSYNEQRYKEVLNKLDKVIDKCKISSSDKDQDKLDKVLCYAVSKLRYDDEVYDKLCNGEDFSEVLERKGFYSEGNLYACFECDTAICGNYTALVKALLKRLGMDNYYLISDTHSWNLIKIEGSLYYVDPTLMDLDYFFSETKVDKDELYEAEWHMESVDTSSADNFDKEHNPVLFPQYMDTEDINEEDTDTYKDATSSTKEIGQEEANIKVGGINYKVPLACLVGILGGLGLAIKTRNHIRRKRRRERIKRIMNRANIEDFYDFNDNRSKNGKRSS